MAWGRWVGKAWRDGVDEEGRTVGGLDNSSQSEGRNRNKVLRSDIV